jgi:lipopolysaccharide export system protein LptA
MVEFPMMMARKHTFLFVIFLLGSSGLIGFSFLGNWDGGIFKEADSDQTPMNSMQESYFKTVQYHVLEKGEPLFMLDADELTMNSTVGKTFFFKPKGFVFTGKGERVDLPDTQANSEKMIYEVKEDRVHLIGDVKTKTFYVEQGDWIYLDADEAYFWTEARRSRYLGNVSGEIKRKRVYEDSLSFRSNELYLNMNTLKADLNHNVFMKKQNLTATSRRGEIFLENYNKKLKYFVLYDDVKVIEKVMLDGKFINRKAFSEKLEGLPSESKIILTGYPKVYQLNDVIKGNKIVLRENTEVVEVDDANSKFKVE